MFGNDSAKKDTTVADNVVATDTNQSSNPISQLPVTPEPTTVSSGSLQPSVATASATSGQNPSSLFTTSNVVDPFGTTPATPKQSIANDPSAQQQDDLLIIKQQALQQLSPLVDHLEQSPEEKFTTTMMMIQATDDKSLIPSAFETAKLIKDDKFKAQAMLDIVNEINYFTQHKQ
ncbi:MAG: hypothetical protein QG645_287 [Patescibacteria group bacterium]|nr:hypothetical protein [Patescibacteria group bacterium]